jgi:HK97 family phage prohead protease
MIRFSAPVLAEASEGRREIFGIAAPYGVEAVVSDGTRVMFEQGALPEDGPAPKLIESHDLGQIRGLVTERRNTDSGMEFTAKIAATAAGNDALELVKMGAIDSVSVGVTPTKWKMQGDLMVIQAADWQELSLVAIPAFAGATITQVAASANPDETPPETVPEEDTEMETPNVEAAAPVTVPTTPNTPLYAQARRAAKLPSAGEYLMAMHRGGHDWHQFNDNVVQIMAATGDVLVSDAAGVVPVPIVAPIYDSINPLRPIVSALGTRGMPEAGATFIRPFIKVRAAVGNQASELAALSTADFEVDDIVVTKKTFGGKLVLSEQVIDFSSPSMLDAAINDMAGQYALATEKETVDRIVAAASTPNTSLISDFADDAEFIADLYTAAASMAETGNYLPNALVVAPKRWATLGSLVDGQGRPVFPQVAPLNGIGTIPGGVSSYNGNPLGLQLIVSNQITDQAIGTADADDFYHLINTRGIECYEQFKGFLRDESVGTLGITIALRGYFSTVVVDSNMIRFLGPSTA